MTLRLVLVSLVVALGMTIPGAPMLESWVASTQNWMNARFADWDTRNPQEADYVIVNQRTTEGRNLHTPPAPPAPTATIATAPQRPAPQDASLRVANRSVVEHSTPINESYRVVIRPASLTRKSNARGPVSLVRVARWELDRDQVVPAAGLGVKPLVSRRPEKAGARVDLAAVGRNFRDMAAKAIKDKLARVPAARTMASQPKPEKKAISPLLVAETLFGGPARKPAGVVAAPKVETPAPTAAAKPTEVIAAKPKTSSPTPVAATPASPPPTSAPSRSVASFGGMEKGKNLYFAGRLESVAVNHGTAKKVEPIQIVTAPATASKPVESKPETAKPAVAAAPKAEPAKTEVPKPVVATAPKAEPIKTEAPKPVVAAAPKAEPAKTEAPKPVVATAPKGDATKPAVVAPAKAEGPATKPEAVASRTARPTEVVDAEALNDPAQELDGLLADGGDGFGAFAPRPAVVLTSRTVSVETAPQSTDLTRAVRLTREAMYAWVNVFTGPAVVTVSQSRSSTTR